MSNSNSNNSSGGMGFFSVLQLIFIVLKLCKVITWSWWIVLIPIWIEVALIIILFILIYRVNRR